MNGGMLLLNNNFSLPVKHSCVYYGIGKHLYYRHGNTIPYKFHPTRTSRRQEIVCWETLNTTCLLFGNLSVFPCSIYRPHEFFTKLLYIISINIFCGYIIIGVACYQCGINLTSWQENAVNTGKSSADLCILEIIPFLYTFDDADVFKHCKHILCIELAFL